MAGELTITVVGNLANDPELRNTNSGIAFVGLNVASTPRTYNRNTSTWEDGETVWVRCTAWRDVADNVARSLTKGTRVIVTGRLKPASAYQSNTGEARASIEIEIEEIGPSLRYATATVTRKARDAGAVDSNAWGNAPVAAVTPPANDAWANPGVDSGFAAGDSTPF
ncbi:MAG: single-stranded DNA-binding protein [Rhodoluna sp.]|jgi:single-strand DNA-binding protein|nr:single-stranded DNA-binding protein [Rhodoluna sp.]